MEEVQEISITEPEKDVTKTGFFSNTKSYHLEWSAYLHEADSFPVWHSSEGK
jgi:hypothetical protein